MVNYSSNRYSFRITPRSTRSVAFSAKRTIRKQYSIVKTVEKFLKKRIQLVQIYARVNIKILRQTPRRANRTRFISTIFSCVRSRSARRYFSIYTIGTDPMEKNRRIFVSAFRTRRKFVRRGGLQMVQRTPRNRPITGRSGERRRGNRRRTRRRRDRTFVPSSVIGLSLVLARRFDDRRG